MYCCRPCYESANGVIDLSSHNPTGSEYQMQKLKKHTSVPSAGGHIISIFNDSSQSAYAHSVSSALHSGFYYEDASGRLSVVGPTETSIGNTYASGSSMPGNALAVVLPASPNKHHGYPTATPSNVQCSMCGVLLRK